MRAVHAMIMLTAPVVTATTLHWQLLTVVGSSVIEVNAYGDN
jgi:hypothetical protein